MVKIEGFGKGKSLGRFTDEGIGASTSFDGEVTKAEYVKGEDGKSKTSAKGNKRIKINVKATKTVNDKTFPVYANVTYYETEYSPKLSEIAPKKLGDKDIFKKVNITFSNGGKVAIETEKGGFGSLDVYNVKKEDGKTSSGLSIFGGNVKVGKKPEGSDDYFVDGFDGEKELLEFGYGISVTLKGVIEPIKDTEKYLKDNYDIANKTLKFNMYCFESEKGVKTIPVLIDNVDEDYSKKIVSKIKTTENNLVALVGEYISMSKKIETTTTKTSSGFGEYEMGGGDYSYEAVIKVNWDEEKSAHKIKFFDKKGKLTVTHDTADKKQVTTNKKDDFDF
jgi:hypothetical protein